MMDILFNLDVDFISDYSNMRSLRFSVLNVLLNNPKKAEMENESLSNSFLKNFLLLQETVLDFRGKKMAKAKYAMLFPPLPPTPHPPKITNHIGRQD